MGKFYKICMVIVKQPFTKMQTGHDAQQALKSFMTHHTGLQSTGSRPEEERMKFILMRILCMLLETNGVGKLSLNDFLSSSFLDLHQDHLRQMMDFLSNQYHIWILHNFLMEVPHLNVEFHDGDMLPRIRTENEVRKSTLSLCAFHGR